MVEFAVESFRAITRELLPLFERHAEEVSVNRADPEPDLATYFAMEDVKRVSVVTARSGGELVGYAVLLFANHLHFREKTAYVDLIYLRPDQRKGMVGVLLLRHAKEQASNMGANRLYADSTALRDISPVLQRAGFVLESHTYGVTL